VHEFPHAAVDKAVVVALIFLSFRCLSDLDSCQALEPGSQREVDLVEAQVNHPLKFMSRQF
jgi:hypothetical protein